MRRERRPRLLLVDEAWSLLRFAEGGAFLAAMARRAQKHYLGLVTITQQVSDLADGGHGESILANAAQVLLLKEKAETIEAASTRFRLTPEERQLLLGADKGEGLLLIRGNRMAIQVVASPPNTDWPRPARGISSYSLATPPCRVPAMPLRQRRLFLSSSPHWETSSPTDEAAPQAEMAARMTRQSRPPRIDTEALKRDHRLVDVIASYGVVVKREGTGTYRALCPFHQEHTPSFWVDARDPLNEHY